MSVDAHTTPHHGRLGDGVDVEFSYDSEVVTAATKGPVEVRVGCMADVEHATTGCDYFIGDDIVAGQAILVGKVRNA